MINAADFRVALRLCVTSRMLPFLFWVLALLVLVVWMAAQFSGRQPATVALDVGLSVLRLALPLLLVLQLQELICREFDRRLFLTSLTYPRPRVNWLLGRWSAMVFVCLGTLLLLALVLAGMVLLIGQGYLQATPVSLGKAYWITIGFMAVDLLVLLAVATLLSVVASTPGFVLLGTLGFMLIARSYSAVLALLNSEVGLVGDVERYRANLGALSYLLPDLGALDVREIALYGRMDLLPVDWPMLLAAGLAYMLAFLFLALLGVQRKHLA